MSVNSILTNSAAANALLNFNKTQNELQDVQSRLSTGQKVGSAKDNASTFAIALGLRSDVATFKTVKENLATGSQIVDSSLSVATSISDQISTLKTKLTQAKDQPQGRALIQQDIDGALDQIKNWTKSATFNGINLLDGKGADAGQKFSVTASLDRNSSGDPTLNSLSFDYQDLSIDKADKGLGSLLGMNVVQGAASETRTAAKAGLVSATFTDDQKYSVAQTAAITGTATLDTVSFTVGTGADQKTFKLDSLNVNTSGTVDDQGSFLVNALNQKLKEAYPTEDKLSFSYDSSTDMISLKDLQNREISNLDFAQADGTTAVAGIGNVAGGAATIDQTTTAFAPDDQFTITYKDASGTQKSLSLKAVQGEPTNSYEFKLGSGATAQKDTLANLKTQLDKLTATGGALEGSGLSFSTTDTSLKVERDPSNSQVELVGISTKNSKTGNAVASTEINSVQAKATNAQIKLDFSQNNALKAGDEISLAVDNNGKEEKLTFRIGGADQSVKNGAKVDGADNTYWLNYRDVVGGEGETRTGAQVAELINYALSKGNDKKASVTSSASGEVVDGLSFKVYGGIAADQTETRSTQAFDAAALDITAATGATFTVGTGGSAFTYKVTIDALTSTGDDQKDLQKLASALNDSLMKQYGTDDVGFAVGDDGRLSLRDYKGRGITASTVDGAGTGLTADASVAAVAAAAATTVTTPTTAAGRFQNIAGSKGVSLNWNEGALTLTDTKQDNKTQLTSFNVNGNSNGLDFSAMMKQADEAEQTVKKVLGSLGSASSRLTAQSSFVDNMVKTLNNNVSTLVDADMAEEAARLQALQTKSQLGIQALSTANQSTQSILSLFR